MEDMGGWDPWPPASAARLVCAHTRLVRSPWPEDSNITDSKAWVQISTVTSKPPDLPKMGGSRGLRRPRIMSLCPNVMTSASALGSSRVANGEPGTLSRRPRRGLAPRILTRSPVTGWQDIEKPTHTYFNTAGHITACFPHPAALGKGRCHLVYPPHCLAVRGTVGPRAEASGLQLRPRLLSPPTGLGTRKTPVEPLQRCKATPTACFPRPWARLQASEPGP